MKSRTLFTIVAVAMLSLVASQSAFGQGAYRGRSDNPNGPTVSPYLNLLGNNNQFSPVTNYQSLVRPLVDQRNSINRQGNAIQRLQQGQGGGPALSGPGTGRSSYFMHFSHFYPSATGR